MVGKKAAQSGSSQKKDAVIPDYLLIKGKSYTILDLEQKIKELEELVTKTKNGIKDKEEELVLLKSVLRENSLKQQFDKFIAKRLEIVRKAVYLNNCLLHLAVTSYYYDIHRYKDYSGSKWANNHKQAAYTIKWIVRFKPIQIKEEFDNEKSLNAEIVDVNLIFALVCGLSFLDRNIVDKIATEKKEVDNYNSLLLEKREGKDKQSFYEKLLYTLRYRPFTGKQLISMFEALEL